MTVLVSECASHNGPTWRTQLQPIQGLPDDVTQEVPKHIKWLCIYCVHVSVHVRSVWKFNFASCTAHTVLKKNLPEFDLCT